MVTPNRGQRGHIISPRRCHGRASHWPLRTPLGRPERQRRRPNCGPYCRPHAPHVDLGEVSVEVRDAVRLGVLAVEARPRQKLVDEERSTRLPRAGAGNEVAARYWKGRDAIARSRARAAKRQEAAHANKYSLVSNQHVYLPPPLRLSATRLGNVDSGGGAGGESPSPVHGVNCGIGPGL